MISANALENRHLTIANEEGLVTSFDLNDGR
jgi:hypothetical protein